MGRRACVRLRLFVFAAHFLRGWKGRIMRLDQLQPGGEGRIKKLSNRDKLGQRLMDMGIYAGLRIKVIRNAPLEDPMEVELDGYCVSLRHEEARFVEVELL
jgi:ferrous iron transport protein A